MLFNNDNCCASHRCVTKRKKGLQTSRPSKKFLQRKLFIPTPIPVISNGTSLIEGSLEVAKPVLFPNERGENKSR